MARYSSIDNRINFSRFTEDFNKAHSLARSIASIGLDLSTSLKFLYKADLS